jgi:hypothetical protein
VEGERERGGLQETQLKERNKKLSKMCITFNSNTVVYTHNTDFGVLI